MLPGVGESPGNEAFFIMSGVGGVEEGEQYVGVNSVFLTGAEPDSPGTAVR